MILAQCLNLEKSYGVNQIFKNISFIIETGDRSALVGANGAGKSTLLKCLVGEETPDNGTITFAKNLTWGYLAQQISLDEKELTAFEFTLEAFQDLIILRKRLRDIEKKMSEPRVYNNAAKLSEAMKIYGNLTTSYEMEGGYTYEAKTKEILTGLGFGEDEWERLVFSFSGGQKTRLGLARLLAREPELLILDEPTNFLDLNAINWLENYLKQYKGAMLVVSHDRYFLDTVATRVMELENGQLDTYLGNYTEYAVKKAQNEAAAKKAFELHDARIKRLTAYVERYRAGIKSKQARGREKQLQKISPLTKPRERAWAKMQFTQAGSSGLQVLTVKNLSFGYDGEKLFNGLNFEINREDRIALIGENGAGKTTLLKIILGEISPKTGKVKFGSKVRPAYFSQEREIFAPHNTVLDEILAIGNLAIEGARSHLARFLFRNDELENKVVNLSGGEKSRLALAKLMLDKGNLLILDEPTNHLDMETRQVLEDALQDFSGTILMISHDRYFINQIANQVWELNNKQLDFFPGDYDYYLWKKEDIRLQKEKESKVNTGATVIKKPKQLKREKAVKTDIKEIEGEIFKKEERLEELVSLLGSQELYKDTEQLIKIQQEYGLLEKELEELYKRWETVLDK